MDIPIDVPNALYTDVVNITKPSNLIIQNDVDSASIDCSNETALHASHEQQTEGRTFTNGAPGPSTTSPSTGPLNEPNQNSADVDDLMLADLVDVPVPDAAGEAPEQHTHTQKMLLRMSMLC